MEMLPSSVVLTAAPTLSGEAVLTPFHPYGTVRHIQNKPVKKFTDRDQFLLIAAAEKEGLLKVQFKVSHVSEPEEPGCILYWLDALGCFEHQQGSSHHAAAQSQAKAHLPAFDWQHRTGMAVCTRSISSMRRARMRQPPDLPWNGDTTPILRVWAVQTVQLLHRWWTYQQRTRLKMPS